MRNTLLLATSLIGLLALCSKASAQSTPNYDCAHALPLAVSPTNIQTEWIMQTMAAGDLAPLVPPAACGGSGNQYARWFSFTATGSDHWIRTDGEEFEFTIEAFSGSCGNLTSIACANHTGTVHLTGLSAGSTYYFRLFGSGIDVTSTDETVGVAVISAAVNDDCASARELFAKPGSAPLMPATETSTVAATQSQPGCSVAAESDDDVWYRFTATEPRHWLLTDVAGTGTMRTEWFSGACGGLTSITCNGTTAGNLSPGQDYYIRQHSASTDPADALRARIDLYTIAPNDECVDAIPVQVALDQEVPEALTFSLMTSTSSTVPCYTSPFDVWVSFTATTSTVVALLDQNMNSALYSGSCGSLTCISSNTYAYAPYTGLIPGDTYYLKLGSTNASGNHSLRLFSAPANDDCADATVVPVQAGGGAFDWITGSTFGAMQSMPGCGAATQSDDDVWYRFTAQDTAQLLYLRSLYDVEALRVELFSGDCNNLNSLFCSSNFNGSNDKLRLGQLEIGASYLFRVYTVSNSDPTGLRVAITGLLPNDYCEGAILFTGNVLSDFPSIPFVDANLVTNGTGSCAMLRDIWYRFIANGTSATFLAPDLTTFNAELLSGTCDALTSVACRTGVTKAAFTDLVVGQEYYLRFSLPAVPRLRPMLFLAPPNDEIGGATLLEPTGSTFAFSAHQAWTYGATKSLSRLCSGQGLPDDDVWFKFVATQADHTIKVRDENLWFPTTPLNYGLLIEAYDPLTLDSAGLAQSIVGCGNGSVSLSGLTVGHTLYFRVYSYLGSATDVTGFLVSVDSGDNDEATGAMLISYNSDYMVIYDTDGATQSQPAANCSVDDFADDDIWFKFVANGPGRLISGNHDADLTLELFSGTPGNLTSVACSDNILVLPSDLVNGQTYYARLYSWKNNTAVSGRFGLFASPSITANTCVDEDCLGPVMLANPGFEQGGLCMPNTPLTPGGDGETLTPVAPGWYDYFYTTPDAFNSCADFDLGQEVPSHRGGSVDYSVTSRNGKGMGGFYAAQGANYKEHQSAPLSEPMVPGEPYLISFYIACQPFGEFHPINGLGALLTTGPPNSIDGLAPQVLDLRVIDGEGWQNICGIVVADKAYDQITIGAFLLYQETSFWGNNLLGSYYFIDDVVVAHIEDANCITGIGDVPPLDEDATASGDALRVYPNPANDRVSIVCGADLFGKRGVIEVFDVTGQRVHAEQVSFRNALQPLELSSEWKEGLYLVMLRVEGQSPRSARVVVRR